MSVAVIIPCYKTSRQVMGVIARIGPEVARIFVIDDFCPEGSGKKVQAESKDPRVKVLFHSQNQGVGGALVTGFKAALEEKSVQIVVKVDGDGQMDPALMGRMVRPILSGEADYTKGNRFHDPRGIIAKMPLIRLLGNSGLSFVNKVVHGYWGLMDPTNGFLAIHVEVLKRIPLEKLDRRYFFESDLLFRAGTVRAVVRDVAMPTHYGDEISSLRPSKILFEFPPKYAVRFLKRLAYGYVLRDFNVGTLHLLTGVPLTLWSVCFGVHAWYRSAVEGVPATAGTVMLAGLPLILGMQLLLSFVQFDVSNLPIQPIHREPLE